MTAAQKLWNRGIQEGEQKGEVLGRREGKQEGRLGIARKMLGEKLPREQISRLTGLNLAQIDRIKGSL
ncbi:MAG: hypothetical protein AAFV97_02590 [Bacteroidota bacterium]